MRAPAAGGGRGSAAEHPAGASARWAWLGVGCAAALALVDLVSGALGRDAVAANLAGTLALAPALTGIGGSRRQVVAVGSLALGLAAALCLLDGVPLLTGALRTAAVALGTAVAAVVAGVRHAQVAQLQDRRQAARTLQAAMLTELPQPDHLQLTSRYLPASSGDQVGGDWYDALVDADGSTTLVIGDVVGHDIGAAATMGQVRAVLRAYAVEGGQEPSEVLARTEAALDRLGLDVLATALVVRVDQTPADRALGLRRIRWAGAGHPPPVLLRPAPEHAGALRAEVLGAGWGAAPDVLLGVGAGAPPRTDHERVVPPGATLLLHTDGLVERRSGDLDEGTAQLCGVLEREGHRPLEELLDAALASLLVGGHSDDVAVLAVRAHPEGGPRPRSAGPAHGAGPADPTDVDHLVEHLV